MNSFLLSLYSFNLFDDFPMYWSHLLALFAAVIAGGLLGLEREKKGKSAGVRTFALVCLGSCLFALIGREISNGAELGRIVSQIVSGVGFLGAGAVIRDGSRSSGMTTAAGIWVCAGLGVVFGLGFFPFGMLITLLVYALFKLNGYLEARIDGPCQRTVYEVKVLDPSGRTRQFVLAILMNEPGVKWSSRKTSDNDESFEITACGNHARHRRFILELAKLEHLEFVQV